MGEQIDVDLGKAHVIGSMRLNPDGEAIFSYNNKIYRTITKKRKLETKLVCNVLAELIGIENKGAQDKPSNEYLFKIQGGHFDYVVESYFKPRNLTSNRTFTKKLMDTVPFGTFCGNKDDFEHYFMAEIEKFNAKRRI